MAVLGSMAEHLFEPLLCSDIAIVPPGRGETREDEEGTRSEAKIGINIVYPAEICGVSPNAVGDYNDVDPINDTRLLINWLFVGHEIFYDILLEDTSDCHFDSGCIQEGWG